MVEGHTTKNIGQQKLDWEIVKKKRQCSVGMDLHKVLGRDEYDQDFIWTSKELILKTDLG